jgi:GMP synthase (glutamine-hydrolysing)
MAPTLLIIEHVPHERLGTFEPAFKAAGCRMAALRPYDAKADWSVLEHASGVVSMGGPMSVYEPAKYPWIAKELALLREAADRGLPILGVCLGAQLLAAALGAAVTKNPQKEIGWYPLMREPGADGDPLFEPFGQTETVFQWHGDTFALPKGAVRLFRSPLCQEQAFRYREAVYGLQFHLEVTEAMIRAWMRHPANRAEFTSLKGTIDPMTIRRQSPQHIERLGELARHVAGTFVDLVKAVRV